MPWSCGCDTEIVNDVHRVLTKGLDCDGSKSLGMILICTNHLDEYKKNNNIFDNSKQACAWLESKEY